MQIFVGFLITFQILTKNIMNTSKNGVQILNETNYIQDDSYGFDDMFLDEVLSDQKKNILKCPTTCYIFKGPYKGFYLKKFVTEFIRKHYYTSVYKTVTPFTVVLHYFFKTILDYVEETLCKYNTIEEINWHRVFTDELFDTLLTKCRNSLFKDKPPVEFFNKCENFTALNIYDALEYSTDDNTIFIKWIIQTNNLYHEPPQESNLKCVVSSKITTEKLYKDLYEETKAIYLQRFFEYPPLIGVEPCPGNPNILVLISNFFTSNNFRYPYRVNNLTIPLLDYLINCILHLFNSKQLDELKLILKWQFSDVLQQLHHIILDKPIEDSNLRTRDCYISDELIYAWFLENDGIKSMSLILDKPPYMDIVSPLMVIQSILLDIQQTVNCLCISLNSQDIKN